MGNGRLPQLLPCELDGPQRELYDKLVAGPRSASAALVPLTDDQGALLGPFNAMLTSPPLGGALQALGAAIRFTSTLTPRAREIAILTVGSHWRSSFEIYAHTRLGREAGLSEEELAGLACGEIPPFEDATERLVADVVRLLVAGTRVPDELYAAACDQLGIGGVFELSTLAGYYTTLAMQLQLFDVSPPA